MRLISSLILVGWMFFSAACMSTRVVFTDQWQPSTKPAYEDNFDSYWFGFVGSPKISLQKVCMDQKVLAFDKRKSLEDGLITFITLGIYTPTTISVWCGDKS